MSHAARALLHLLLITGLAPAVGVAGPAKEPKRYPIPSASFRHELGHCYIASMDFGEDGDRATRNKSMLVLYEDGKPLGPPRSVHKDIREKGRGRYSHWMRTGLYMSASDNSDPRTNGRTYEVASANPRSTLGGLTRFPARERRHVEEITASRHEYAIQMGGTLDMENTRTLACGYCTIAFQPNVALVIENVGSTPVVNPRVVVNDRGNWYTFENLLAEFTRGAKTDQEKVYLIWQNMRDNLYHELPLFANNEPHDPVKLFNVYGLNLCDDAGNAGCSLFYHAGFKRSKNRALRGHVQCEAFIDGDYQFMDVDMDCFYLDRENEKPVSGDACARDHDLARRELNYGQVVSAFRPSDHPAALFGPDDTQHDARHRGHAITYTLRPGEKVIFRWDNIGKYAAESAKWAHLPKFFGNSKFIYRPRLSGAANEEGLVVPINVPYAIAGGTIRARFLGKDARDRFALAISTDGKKWTPVWKAEGAGQHDAAVVLDKALDVLNAPAKYGYRVRVRSGTAGLEALEIETDVMAAPVSLPRLGLGANRVVYTDETKKPHRVRVTHQWRETDAVEPLPAVKAPQYPEPGAEVRDSIVTFRWAPVKEARRYHLQVSRRPDFAYPYRTSLDVVIPTTTWCVPFTGIFSPDTTYYWRLRCRDGWGVWGAWSTVWTFTWRGPRVPVHVRAEVKGHSVVLKWEPNPRGKRPAKYEVYGSDEKGFSVAKGEHSVAGLGKVPGNFLAETTETSMEVVSPTATAANANKVFYRVVAVDAHGTASGCSDYAELPHPFVYSQPVAEATLGRPYRYQVKSLASLGDLQNKPERAKKPQGYAYKFWDIEHNAVKLLEGPTWLTVDSKTGLLTGTPGADDAGTARVRVEVANQFKGRTEQQFQLTVTPQGKGPL